MICGVNRIALGLLLVSGCIKGATEDQTEAPPPDATPRTEAVYAAQPDEPRDDTVLASLSEEEAAYWTDCSHRPQVQEDESEELVDACLYQEFDQNCAPDPSGCWDKGQACVAGCGPACDSCDDACSGGCDGCKAKCAKGDSACRVACVQDRADCHEKCMSAKETCVETTCRDEEKQCYDAHETVVADKCPKCEQIRDCFGDAIERDADPLDFCGKKFKREPNECFEWCGDW
jgi:hypothetical protein